MKIKAVVDLQTRAVRIPPGIKISAYDHNVDVVEFSLEQDEEFQFDLSSIRVAAKGPDKSRHDYAIDPSTISVEEETGYVTFEWEIPQGVTEMPLDTFKYGDTGQLIFAVCAEIISGSALSKAWHSDDGIITVVAHLEPESGGGEDPEEEATNAQKIGQLQTDVAVVQRQVAGVAGGVPTVVDSVSDMTDTNKIYVLSTDGKWYYHDGTTWTSGGTYGGAVTDTTLSISGAAADAKAVGDALAEKADADDVGDLSQLTTTAKDNLVSAINEAAADAKATGDVVANINGRLDGLIVTNILYSEASKVVSGTGTYVYEAILEINNPVADTVYNFEVSGVSGTDAAWIGYIYSFDADDVRSNHPMTASNKKVSYTVLPTDTRLSFELYPSYTGAVTATYTDVIIYTGNAPYKYVKPDYIRVEIDGDDIPDASISRQKLSFAELVAPENLFDYTSEDMCKPGWWYYGTTIGNIVSAAQSDSTTHYVAIKVPVYDSTKITLGIYPDDLSKLVYWVGAVDADMRLIAYNIVNQNAPVTYNLPEGTIYFLASYNLGSANFNKYLPRVMAVNADAITGYSAYFKPYYKLLDCKTDVDDSESITNLQSIVGSDENSVTLELPDKYDLVVGDTFQLFYKGIINAVNPEMYYVLVDCAKGNAYSRYFEVTPDSAGNLTATFTLFGINHNVLDTKAVTLAVHAKASSPSSTKNVLCVGDSLTTAGQWVEELHRRLTGSGGTPVGDNLSNINFIGTRVSNNVHYEGYGGWTIRSYNTENVSFNVREITCTHDKTEATDQHSVYRGPDGVLWKLETIRNDTIKIIAVSGEGRSFPNSGTLTWVSGGTNHSDIVYTAQQMAAGNPFWDSTENKVDFSKYATSLGVSSIDYVYVLIGWNSASWSESDYKADAQTFIDNVHASFPNAVIVFSGLEIPARDGLGNNYGATGIYSRYYDLMQFVFNLDKWYAEVAGENNNTYSYNLSGQFDTEYNMLTATRPVNTRNSTEVIYQSNGVHPALSGQMQIADAAYRDITGRLT